MSERRRRESNGGALSKKSEPISAQTGAAAENLQAGAAAACRTSQDDFQLFFCGHSLLRA